MPENFCPAKRAFSRARASPGRPGGPAGRDAQRVQPPGAARRCVDVPPEHVWIVPHGIPEPSVGPGRRGRPGPGRRPLRDQAPFFVYPAITYPHKNHADARAGLRRRGPGAPRGLRWCSPAARARRRGRSCETIRGLGLDDRVRRTGRIPWWDLDAPSCARPAALALPVALRGLRRCRSSRRWPAAARSWRRRHRPARGGRRRRCARRRRRPRGRGPASCSVCSTTTSTDARLVAAGPGPGRASSALVALGRGARWPSYREVAVDEPLREPDLVLCPALRARRRPDRRGHDQHRRASSSPRGHRLHVVTALPWYQHHAIEPGWDGRLVRHEDDRLGPHHPGPPVPDRQAQHPGPGPGLRRVHRPRRRWSGVLHRQRPDAVLAMSPPLTLGPGRLVGGPGPASAVRLQHPGRVPRRRRRAGRASPTAGSSPAARGSERFTYRRSDAVTVLSDDLRRQRAGQDRGRRGRRRSRKVRVIPNFVDTDRIRPATDENAYRAEFGLAGKPGRDVRRQRRALPVARPGARRRLAAGRPTPTSCS